MKNAKERVIAIDYFRGICILMVIVNHSWMFSMPFAYLTGAGGLWTSAAELFFLLSGVTMMIVRGKTIKSEFSSTAKKIWRRAGSIYLLYALLVSVSLSLIYILPTDVSRLTLGPTPTAHGATLLWQILSFQYSIGLASFLMYYSVFLVFTPLVLYVMRTRAWLLALCLSLILFVLASSQVLPGAVLTGCAVWQLYFVLGLSIGRFRVPVISRFYSLPKTTIKWVSALIVAATLVSVAVSALLAFNLYPTVNKLAGNNWPLGKVRGAYFHLLNHQSLINQLLRDDRLGLLRPLASLLFLAAGYLVYQRYKTSILARTGHFVNAMGRDTLWIFAAQAVAIPLITAISLPRDLLMNLGLTSFLILLMWLVTQRRAMREYSLAYLGELKDSYNQAKYAYSYRSENDA